VDVRVGVVDEDAGLHVATGVHMAVETPPANASLGELAVVLEVLAKIG